MYTAKLPAALAVLVLACASAGPQPAGHDTLQALGQRAYANLWDFDPVDATRSGFHGHDSLLGDYTPERTASLRDSLHAFIRTLGRMDAARLSADDRIDRELLTSNLAMELFWLDDRHLLERDPEFYAVECINGIYFLLLRDFAPEPERAANVARRMEQVPRFIAQARRNVKDPPRLFAEAAVAQLGEAEAFYRQSADALGRDVPGLRDRLAAAAGAAEAAMDTWRGELVGTLPRLSDNFAMGKKSYDYLLRTEHFLPFDSDSLRRMGENLLRWSDSAIAAQTRAREQATGAVPAAAPAGPAPRGFGKSDLRRAEAAEVDSMRAWVSASGFATVPGYVGELRIVETPEFLRGIIPGLAMEPPAPLDSVRTGYMYVPPLPDTFDSVMRQQQYASARQHGSRGGIVHEGFPGHFLQLSIADHNPSLIRRMQENTCLIEGWALYCEQMVVDQGLYPPDSFPDLRWLGGVKFRAARIVADVGLGTGRMSYDSAWRFMVANAGPDTAFMQAEVRRYCLSPGQPMSYLVGKTEITRLRDDYRRLKGPGFTLRDFHDRLLAEGSIPPSLLRQKLLAGRDPAAGGRN